MTCTFDPTGLKGQPLGMFHCPECGEMVVAGIPHLPPEDDILNNPLTNRYLRALAELAAARAPVEPLVEALRTYAKQHDGIAEVARAALKAAGVET